MSNLAYNKLESEDRNKVLRCLQEEPYLFSFAQAREIETFIYNEKHSHWSDYQNFWRDFADVFRYVRDLEKENDLAKT